jgi:hypothetical protein
MMEEKKKNIKPTKLLFMIEGYKYTLKDKYKKGICYRCHNRKLCKLTIIITEKLIDKLKNKKEGEEIKVIINSRQTSHTCNKEIVKSIDVKNILTNEEIMETAKTIIKLNLEKDITFLSNNLRQNNIVLPKRKIYSIKNNLI